ncbi:MAG TPA: hypothetical protein VLK23_09795 [Thermodesulfobacteriota bacterium]|nr:hypothetical protein [Thermodesulfobacteriota bacterium]
MRNWFLIRFASHIIVFWLALSFTPITTTLGIPLFGYNWRDMYVFVWPEVFLGAIALLLDIRMLLKEKAHRKLFWWSLVLEPLLAMGWWFPFLFRLWPGGDDGGGMAWLILLGGACGVAATVSAIGAWRALKIDRNIRAVGIWPVSRSTRFILTLGVSVTAAVLNLKFCIFWFSGLLAMIFP